MAMLVLAGVSNAHPIEKVVNLLQKLKGEAIEEGKTEQVAFEKFKYWCSTGLDELDKAIAEEKNNIDELVDQIKGLEATKKELEAAIDQLSGAGKKGDDDFLVGEIPANEADAARAKTNDDKRNKAYIATKADLKSTIKSVGEAVTALLKAGETDSALLQQGAQDSVRQALAFLSMAASEKQQAVLMDFVSGKPDQLAAGDLKTHTKKYSFKSDNVIGLLKELVLKFEDDLTAADVEETAAANGYALEKKARDNELTAMKKSLGQKTKNLGDTKSSLSQAESDRDSEKDDLKADSKTLKDTTTACGTADDEWATRSKTRSGEIEALSEGIKILAKVSGVRTEAPSNPVLPTSPVFFLQIKSEDPKINAINLLRQTAKETHSKALERLALEVSTHLTGPFDKVNDMIQKMVFRLMSEQTDEDKHKAWCDLELDKTKDSKEDKEDKIKQLDLDIKSENAAEAKNTLDITAADKMVADIVDFMNEATEIRQAGKHENKVSIKDAKDAQTAIANAHAVLEDFYKSSGEISMIQGPVVLPKDPKLWSAGYTGVSDPKNAKTGVLSILETCAADFSKMEADTKAQEAEDQKDYDSEMSSHKIEKDRRATESAAKGSEKKRHIQKAGELTKQKKHTNDELDAVKQYSKDLQPACVDGDSSFKDRKAARAKEIAALKSAQKTLQAAFTKKSSSFLQIHAA